jgi:hypothetical protein
VASLANHVGAGEDTPGNRKYSLGLPKSPEKRRFGKKEFAPAAESRTKIAKDREDEVRGLGEGVVANGHLAGCPPLGGPAFPSLTLSYLFP